MIMMRLAVVQALAWRWRAVRQVLASVSCGWGAWCVVRGCVCASFGSIMLLVIVHTDRKLPWNANGVGHVTCQGCRMPLMSWPVTKVSWRSALCYRTEYCMYIQTPSRCLGVWHASPSETLVFSLLSDMRKVQVPIITSMCALRVVFRRSACGGQIGSFRVKSPRVTTREWDERRCKS